jgi:hypothetical protein
VVGVAIGGMMPEYMDDGVPEIPEEKISAFAEKVGVTIDQIHSFLEAKGWDNALCEICRNENFTLEVMGDLPAPVTLPAAVSPAHAKWVIPLRCNHCGNMKLVDFVFLREWVKESLSGD